MTEYKISTDIEEDFITDDFEDAEEYYNNLEADIKASCEFTATTYKLFGGQWIETNTENLK